MHHWCYDDDDIEHGPASWPTGTKQSPIDIDLACVQRVDTPDAIKFINYEHAIKGDICNNGHSVQMNPIIQCEHPEIYGGGLDQVYQLVQYHFHWGSHDNTGSEHRIGGLQYPAELHLVHRGTEDPNKLVVIGIFLRLDKEDAVTQIDHVYLSEKLPRNRGSFWRYEGSLTTPPCSEIVTWTLFTEPVGVTHEQLELFRQVEDCDCRPIRHNFRPVQALCERKVEHWVVHGHDPTHGFEAQQNHEHLHDS
ncbi:hypothetical protein WR25_09499 [Diploscapter pachys]|uniref:Carbonic anhydrase n=1 Tax=Diploscapter pachys TaxID=2018661 RepID=A0A2A2J2Y8_9BILA|nr:hypothetical protein WR25_09499 [Diploscapter pachys]